MWLKIIKITVVRLQTKILKPKTYHQIMFYYIKTVNSAVPQCYFFLNSSKHFSSLFLYILFVPYAAMVCTAC